MFYEIILFVILVFLIFHLDKKPKNFPPGRWGLPVIGDLREKGLLSEDTVEKMRQQYGNTFSHRAGAIISVHLTDFQTIKSVFNRPEMQGRPKFFNFQVLTYFKNLGYVWSEGEKWVHNRRFALKQLKDLGVGKTRMQTSIQNEAKELVSYYEKIDGEPTDFGFEVNVAVLNVIWQLVASRRYNMDNEKILLFIRLMNETMNIIQGPAQLLSPFPWLSKILPKFVSSKLFRLNEIYEQRDLLYGYIKEIIEEHVQNHDQSDPQDFIDYYLLEMANEKTSTGDIDYSDLIVSIGDLFLAGSETTSSTLRWLVLLLATHPEEQRKAQDLIDEVVPRSTQPSLEDRNQLRYVDAIILETLRFSSFIPKGVPHLASSDCLIDGYDIPKGTIIIPCHATCHYEEKFFERPRDFYPNHFIGENGELLTKKDGFAPFSIGRRQCLGENLARAEMFIFATTILQNFTIKPHPDHPLDLKMDKTQPIFNFAKPYKVCFIKRNK